MLHPSLHPRLHRSVLTAASSSASSGAVTSIESARTVPTLATREPVAANNTARDAGAAGSGVHDAPTPRSVGPTQTQQPRDPVGQVITLHPSLHPRLHRSVLTPA